MIDLSKFHYERFLRPILASRFLTISALIHLLIIVLFGGRVLFNKYVEPPDFQSAGDSTVSTEAPPAPPQTPEETLPPAPTTAVPPPPTATTNMTALTSLNSNATSFSMPMPAMAPPTLSKNLSATAAVATQTFGNGTGPALPGSMSGRTGAGRERASQEHGQKPASEQAVLRALRWLMTQQLSDGTWGTPGGHDAFTGLALLCFLGHGETPQNSHEFGSVLTNAINALVAEGNKNQSQFGGGGVGTIGSQSGAYEHGICTYALCEAYTMTKDERLLPIVTQAVDYIVKGQRPDGGWAYGYSLDPKFGGSDTSVSGWQIQALKAAHLTGIPGMAKTVQPVLDLAMKNMDRVYNPKDGSYGYRGPQGGYSLTGVGVLAKLFWLGRPDKTIRLGIKNMQSRDLAYDAATCSLYTWYYDTQACFQAQGGAWSWWNQRFQKQLTDNQSADGSWPPTGNGAGGIFNTADGDGPLYRTTLCCLMLEVYYRYLPTSKETALGGSVQGL